MVMFCLRQEQKPKKEPTMKSIVKFAGKGVDIKRLQGYGTLALDAKAAIIAGYRGTFESD